MTPNLRFRPFLGLLVLLSVLLGAVLTACEDEKSSSPASSIEAYLKALVEKNEDTYFATICPAWEADAQLEHDAFWAVTAELDGVACTQSGTEDDTALVTCTGQILLNYDGETRERPLTDITYLAQQHDGNWKMCGYR